MAMGLYDIHCHLVPGVDDGSQNMEESLAALKLEYEEGIRTIIITPHFSADNEPDYHLKVKAAFDALKENLAKEPYGSEMELYLGNELMYSDGILECLEQGRAFTMAGSHYVLVEFMPDVYYKVLYEGLRTLASNGYIPILAHMERYHCLRKNTDRLDELDELGVLLQVNGKTLEGGIFDFECNAIKKLFKTGRIRFISTDSHGTHYRKPDLKKAAEWVKAHCSEEDAEGILVENPKAVLEDRLI